MKEFEIYEQDCLKLPKGGIIKGKKFDFKYAIVRQRMGQLCGYVQVPKKLFDLLDAEDEITCHGGVTYEGIGIPNHEKEGFWIGFDCMHYTDWSPMHQLGTYKNIDFVLNEIRNIIKQLRRKESGKE